MALRLSRLFSGWDKQPDLFRRYWDESMTQIENNINAINDLPIIQAAVDAAAAAAAAANAAAAAANGAATTAQSTATAATRESNIVNSYINPVAVLTANTTTITVAGHTRIYGDGTSVSVTGGTLSVTAMGDTDYVYYTDVPRTGGAVTYLRSTTQPPQTGDTHVVGAVTIPSTGSVSGGEGPRKPGFVEP